MIGANKKTEMKKPVFPPNIFVEYGKVSAKERISLLVSVLFGCCLLYHELA